MFALAAGRDLVIAILIAVLAGAALDVFTRVDGRQTAFAGDCSAVSLDECRGAFQPEEIR